MNKIEEFERDLKVAYLNYENNRPVRQAQL